MTQSEKKQIIIMIGVMLAIILILLVVKGVQKEDESEGEVAGTQVQEFVEKQEDGTNLNTSEELKKTKTLGSLEFSNIALTSKDGESYITAKVKNTGSSKAGDEFIKITVLDKEGKELTTVNVYIETIEAGKETTLSSKTSSDFVNAHDFRISK